MNLRIEQLAIHYVDRASNVYVQAPREQQVARLHHTIQEFLVNLVREVWEADDTGSTRSASFVADDDPQLGPATAKQYIAIINRDHARFLEASRNLANYLFQRAPGNASPGVFAVMRLSEIDTGKEFVALIKIRYEDADFVRLVDEALTQLDVEQVKNMLLQGIQKGAIIPHPDRDDYDLKVIDAQAPDDPAKYFTEKFLGCRAKKSDEYQVRRLIPELELFARKRHLPFNSDQLPDFISTLQRRRTNVTTDAVVEAAVRQRILGDEVSSRDLKTYFETESPMGPINVPAKRFSTRGKKEQTPRRITYEFTDPAYSGVVISGPASIVQSILSSQGDRVRFVVQTTKDGYKTTYE